MKRRSQLLYIIVMYMYADALYGVVYIKHVEINTPLPPPYLCNLSKRVLQLDKIDKSGYLRIDLQATTAATAR